MPAPSEPLPPPAAVSSPKPTEVARAEPVPPPAPSADPPVAVSSPEIETLLARGDELLANGDVAAARLFYQRAAEKGSAAAATAVGQTYDPNFLDQVHIRGARGDARTAGEWYSRAIAAGDRQAELRLRKLMAKPPG